MENEKVRFFISCAPGIERVLEQEARQLGLLPLFPKSKSETHEKSVSGEESGGLNFEGFYSHVMSSNLHLRTASRVIVRLGEFNAAAFSELRKKASRLEWEKYLIPGQSVNIRATCHKSRLYHSSGVEERVLGAINDHFTFSHAPQKPCTQDAQGQLILVRLVYDQCTISVDSSGDPLHMRGYRLASAKAPLRENLAAAMLLSAGWNGQASLIDPFCGAGTIPIEAALIARRIAPGIARNFAFSHWPVFQKNEWEKLLETARKQMLPISCSIMGFDRDKGAIEMAIANASRAGQKADIKFIQQAVSFLEPTAVPGYVITNPPYGVRISENKDLRDLYARFGSILQSKFAGWKIGILCNDPKLIGNLGIGKSAEGLHFSNGGLPVQFSQFEINR